MSTYNKLLLCGDVIYWYEYDKPPTQLVRHEKKDSYEPLDLKNTKLPDDYFKIDRKEERRSQTLRDGSNKVMRLALLNFSPKTSSFLTLTFEDHVTDIYYSDNEFKNFIKRLKYDLKESIKYLAVRELTKKGRIHYHMLVDSRLGLPKLPEGYKRYKGPDGKTYNNSVAHEFELNYVFSKEKEIAKIWRFGFVDVKPLYGDIDNIGAYLVKYMTKNIALEMFPGKNFYLRSRGLKEPVPVVGDAAEKLIEELNLRKQKEVFSNSYITEYQDLCVFKEINLKRNLLNG